MQKIDLLNCPFCGGKAETFPLDKYDSYGNHEMLWYSECGECFARSGYYNTEGEAAIAWNTRASGWIPCSERLPKYDHYVLVWHKPNNMIYTGVLDYDDNGWELDDNLGEYRYASFENAPLWMPLPEFPKRKDDAE